MRDRDYGPYGWTLYLEAVASIARFLPSLVVASIVTVPLGFILFAVLGTGGLELLPGLTILVACGIAVAPVILSVLTLTILPGGYGLTAKELGAREMSARERETVLAALRQITAGAPKGTIGPTHWLVIDMPDPNAFVVGTTIYLHRGLISSEFLEPVMAHELGHINHGDGRLVLALRALVPPPFSYISFEQLGCGAMLYFLFFGGTGLLVTSWGWNRHWQKREYLADRFACECGQATGLIELLEHYQFFDVAVPFAGLRSDHPYTEKRIGRLLACLEELEDAELEAEAGIESREASLFERETVHWDRKQGFTDAEAVLDMVFVDEAHVGWGPPEQVAAEKAWIRVNGRRLVDRARSAHIHSGQSYLIVTWDTERPEEWIAQTTGNALAHFIVTVREHEYLIGQRARDFDWEHWRERIATFDPERAFVVIVSSMSPDWPEAGGSLYLVGMQGGGRLPAFGEEPPGRRR